MNIKRSRKPDKMRGHLSTGTEAVTSLILVAGFFLWGSAAAAETAFAGEDSSYRDNAILNSCQDTVSAAQPERPGIMEAVDGIPGWVRTGEPLSFKKGTLYGHINGGAEIVLQYGFRELAVHYFKPEGALNTQEEIILELYWMESGEAAFGIYSTKVEGGEETSSKIGPAHWISPGQANIVKGEFLVNILAPDSTLEELEDFAAAVEPMIPGDGTDRPEGINWLPEEGLIPGSERYIKGEAAALNESPLFEKPFWGFVVRNTTAYSAKYGPFPSRVVIVDFGGETSDIEDLVLELFMEYLSDARKSDEAVVEGRSPVGHWFLYKQIERRGRFAALVLGEPDEETARSRLADALKRITY